MTSGSGMASRRRGRSKSSANSAPRSGACWRERNNVSMSENQLLFLVLADLDLALRGEFLRGGDDRRLRLVDIAQPHRAQRCDVVLQDLAGALRHALEEQLAQLL